MKEMISHISMVEWCLMLALVAALGYQVYFYLRYMVLRTDKRLKMQNVVEPAVPQEAQLDLFAPTVKGVSVIVAAHNEGNNLRNYLHALVEQDYPMFEVIVVNDGSEDDTRAVLDEYQVKYPRLRTTFVPVQARVLSSKKLALTLAIKAAKFEYLLLTDADCRPESKHWITEMMRGFEQDEQVDIVLGYGAYFIEKGYINRLTQYETLFTGLQYMGMAHARKPYMGVGRNLAYRKQLFMQQNGFSGIIGERAGDDDLFVNHAATSANTIVVSSRESMTWSIPKRTWKTWYQQRKRHLGVSSLYTISSKLRLTMEPLTRGVCYAVMVALLVVGTPLTQVTAAVLLLMRLVLMLAVLNYGAYRLKGRYMGIEVLWWDITMPLLTLWLMCLPHKRNQIW